MSLRGGATRPAIRCKRHNWVFDLNTGKNHCAANTDLKLYDFSLVAEGTIEDGVFWVALNEQKSVSAESETTPTTTPAKIAKKPEEFCTPNSQGPAQSEGSTHTAVSATASPALKPVKKNRLLRYHSAG